VSFVYKQDYVSVFAKNAREFNEIITGQQTAVESLYPVFIGNQLSATYNQFLSRRQHLTMCP